MTSVRRARLVSLDLYHLAVLHSYPHAAFHLAATSARTANVFDLSLGRRPFAFGDADDAFGSETAAAAAVAIASLEKLRRVNVSFPIIPPSLYTKSESRNDNLCPCFDEVLFLRKIIYTCQGLNEGNSICADDGAFWNYRYSRLE